MRKKVMYEIFSGILSILFTVIFLSNPVFAQESGENKINVAEDFVLISEQGNEQYYVSSNELLMAEVEQSELEQPRVWLAKNGDLVKEVNADIKFYSTEIDRTKREALLSPITRSGNLETSKQEMNSMGNIKATLRITYSYIPIGSKQGLHLCKATASYQRLLNEGVVVNSGELHYNVSGKIYKNGVFSQNGSIGNTYTGNTFSNKQLMPEGTCVTDRITAGANYTLYCTRGVTVNVNIPF